MGAADFFSLTLVLLEARVNPCSTDFHRGELTLQAIKIHVDLVF